jgi:arylsulfatase A
MIKKYFSFSPILLILILLACNSNTPDQNPNILLMIADDLGYGDLGCYGGVASSPHLDDLAQNGIRFTDFYAAAPNCSPSRTGLMTGISPSRLGMYNYRPPKHVMHLKSEALTIAELVKEKEYQTVHIGKWHLGCLPQDSTLMHPQPIDQGFEYSLGTENNAEPSHLNPANFVRNGKPVDDVKGYSCQILADELITWWEAHLQRNKPFFAYVAFHEPHKKVASPPELTANYNTYQQKDAEYFANVENMDLAIGRILEYLSENNLSSNTIIFFSSDNGSYRMGSNGPLRAVKSYLYEGGIRVPGIVSWPGRFPSNITITEPAGFVDLMPTICKLLSVQHPYEDQLDGTSILKLLKGDPFERKSPLYWFFYRTSPEIAMRYENYVIMGKDLDTIPRTHRFSQPDMEYLKTMSLQEFEVYDLSKDPGQEFDLANMQVPEEIKFEVVLRNILTRIQDDGVIWQNLPDGSATRKLKTDWVKY